MPYSEGSAPDPETTLSDYTVYTLTNYPSTKWPTTKQRHPVSCSVHRPLANNEANRVPLPGDQEVVAALWSRRQLRDGWRYEVTLPVWKNGPGDSLEPAEYRVRVRAPDHVRPVDGVSYDDAPWRWPCATVSRTP